MMTLLQEIHAVYSWLPGGAIVPLSCAVIGLLIGLVQYIHSFKYLYAYYIEHGEVICWMEQYVSEMRVVAKKHKLAEFYNPSGYVSGILGMFFYAIIGIIIGTIWPVSVAIGVLTIPNFALRYFAKERRNKAIFEQELKGTK